MRPNIDYHNKLVIGEDLFIIDADHKRLQDAIHPKNSIPYSQMIDGIDHCSFIYNKREKCLAPQSFIGYNNQGDYVMVSIPKTVLHLKHDYSLRGNDQINLISNIHQRGFQMLGLRYAERVLGITPRIKAGIQDYYFRIKENTLGLSLGSTDIQLDQLSQVKTDRGNYHEALYNLSSQQLISMKPLCNSTYEGHYWVRIPDAKRIDPVGAALLEGKVAYSYINDFPLHQTRMAMYQDRQATVVIDLAGDDYKRKLLEAKGDFLTAIKTRLQAGFPAIKTSDIDKSWLPFREVQAENRVSRYRKTGL